MSKDKLYSCPPTAEDMIHMLMSAKANGDPSKYAAFLTVEQAHAIGHMMETMRFAMQEFVDLIDQGQVRSLYTYEKFKWVLKGKA